jgi:hypothetical protein
MVCHPVEGMLIECDTKTITKAGIHAEVVDKNGVVPITVFIARDVFEPGKSYSNRPNTSHIFDTMEENQTIFVKIIGTRFELNDPFICVIGQLNDPGHDEHPRNRQRGGLSRLMVGEDYVENLIKTKEKLFLYCYKECIKKINYLKKLESNKDSNYHFNVINATGPLFLTKIINKLQRKHESLKSKIIILPSDYFCCGSYGKVPHTKNIFIKHHFTGTWLK